MLSSLLKYNFGRTVQRFVRKNRFHKPPKVLFACPGCSMLGLRGWTVNKGKMILMFKYFCLCLWQIEVVGKSKQHAFADIFV